MLVHIAAIFKREQRSIQREILMRLSGKRPALSLSDSELISIYDKINKAVSYPGTSAINKTVRKLMLTYPSSTKKMMQGRKIPIADLEQFRLLAVANIKPHSDNA